MTDDDSIMNEAQAGDAVARYLEEHPELLQEIVPEHDLWLAIENRISARVIPMSAAGATKIRRAGSAMRWIPMLIAASVLVASTAGITYIVTQRGIGSASHPEVATNVANPDTIANVAGNATVTADIPSSKNAQTQTAQSQSGLQRTTTTLSGAQKRGSQVTTPATQLAAHSDGETRDEARTTYDTEIASLHTMLEARRSHLNPETMAVIEKNLQVIDDAIRQSREALAKDPNSRLLNSQLDRTLAQKTGLLRAAVLLPAA